MRATVPDPPFPPDDAGDAVPLSPPSSSGSKAGASLRGAVVLDSPGTVVDVVEEGRVELVASLRVVVVVDAVLDVVGAWVVAVVATVVVVTSAGLSTLTSPDMAVPWRLQW
jgi:hypothetical protein